MWMSILVSGLALGSVYATIGISYNTMFQASRVMSFTAGQVGMLGGVLGAAFMLHGLPPFLSLLATLLCCAVVGLIVEFVAVRPVLARIDQHLYVVSTLAFAIVIQQLVAILWSTEPQPFPRLLGEGTGLADEKYWLPMVACAFVFVGLHLLLSYTLTGRAFLAVAEDTYLARALGLPERGLRMASFALAGAIGGLIGFASGQLLLAFFANGAMLIVFGFIPVALGGLGSATGALIAGLALGLLQQTANFLVGGVFSSIVVFSVFILAMLLRPNGLFGDTRERLV